MRKAQIWKWEEIDDKTSRNRVLGGWILAHEKGVLFIADKYHEWSISYPAKEKKAAKD